MAPFVHGACITMDTPAEKPAEERDDSDDPKESLDLAKVLADECLELHAKEVDLPEHERTAESEQQRLRAVIAAMHECPERTALCISGGGIRSATFSLGVLQGLALNGFLERFTYLSTVSGGGYIGSWLSSWIHREKTKAKGVCEALIASVDRTEDEAQQIQMLRAYSNYMTPQLGLLSADTWTLIATVIRNILLNWLVIVPPVAIALLAPVLWSEILKLISWWWLSLPLFVLGFGLLTRPIAYIGKDLPSSNPKAPGSQGDFLRHSLAPLVLSAVALSTAWSIGHWQNERLWLGILMAFGVVVHLVGWLMGRRAWKGTANTTGVAGALAAIFIVGMIAGWLVWLCLPMGVDPASPAYLVCAVPALLGFFQLATTLYVGIASKWTTDEDREWWARASAWILIAGLAWLVVTAAGLYGPILVRWAWAAASGPVRTSLFTLSGLSGVATWIIGKSAATPAKSTDGSAGKQETALALTLAIAAPLFVVSLVLLIAFLASVVDERLDERGRVVAPGGDSPHRRALVGGMEGELLRQRESVLAPRDVPQSADPRVPRRHPQGHRRQTSRESLHRLRRGRQPPDARAAEGAAVPRHQHRAEPRRWEPSRLAAPQSGVLHGVAAA